MSLSDTALYSLSFCQKLTGWTLRGFARRLGTIMMMMLAATLAGLLSGCASPDGFDEINANQFISSIILKNPESREDQLFNQRFESMVIYEGAEKRYRLDYRLTGTSSSTLSVRGASSTLKNSTMSISFSLIRLEDGKTVYEGSVVSRAASGTVSAYYAQQKSQQFVTERLAGNLAEKVINKLILYASQAKSSPETQ